MSFKVGLIGAGIHGARYLRHAAADVPDMSVSALCRRDEAAGQDLARDLGCRYHREPEQLIADPTVDGVIVTTPPSTHFGLAAAVLTAGKPLLLEKPMTGTLDQARQLAQLAARPDAPPVMVAQTLRWNPVLQKVKDLWPRLGRVHLIRLAQRLAPTSLPWQRSRAETVGGSVLLTGVHIFDLACWLTGRRFIDMDSRQANLLNPAVEDLFLARGHLDDGTWVSLEVSKYTQSRACWLEAVGQDAQIHADYLTGGITLRHGTSEETFDVSATVPTLPLVLKDWLAALQGDGPIPVTVDDGLATLEAVDACYRSAESGQGVAIAR